MQDMIKVAHAALCVLLVGSVPCMASHNHYMAIQILP